MAKAGPFDADWLDRILAGREQPRSEEEREVVGLARLLEALASPDLRPEFFAALEERLVLEPAAAADTERVIDAPVDEPAQLAALASALQPLPKPELSETFVTELEQRLLTESLEEPAGKLPALSERLGRVRKASELDSALSHERSHHGELAELVALAQAMPPLPTPPISEEFVQRLEQRLLSEPMADEARTSFQTIIWRLRTSEHVAAAAAVVIVLSLAVGRIVSGPVGSDAPSAGAPIAAAPLDGLGEDPGVVTGSENRGPASGLTANTSRIGTLAAASGVPSTGAGQDVVSKTPEGPTGDVPVSRGSPPSDSTSGTTNAVSNQQKALLDGIRSVVEDGP